jgi:uncharacterized protein YceK
MNFRRWGERRHALASSWLAGVVCLSGCSTIGTLNGALARDWTGEPMRIPWIYSGVHYDFRDLAVANESFELIDLPFSLVADTLVLPFTIFAQLRWGSRDYGPTENSTPAESVMLSGAANPGSRPHH